jgi:mono/diheme cytochrome c family protein
MKRDFASCMIAALFGLPIFLILFIVGLYIAFCGFSTNCSQVALPAIIHTPIPTLIPASLTNPASSTQVAANMACTITAHDLLSSWVSAGYTEDQLLGFRDKFGNICNATFANILPLFTQPDLWYPSAPACDTCHSADINAAAANLDLSNYQGILAGGKRSTPGSKGEDILGGGVWANSLLNQVLFVYQTMPPNAPAGALSPDGPTIIGGAIAILPPIVPTEGSGEEEVARPGNPGGPGSALSLTGDLKAGETVYSDYCEVCHGPEGTDNVPNPGSDDLTVPPVNPIDPTLISSDYATYAYNLDLFIQNGSTPEGPNAAYQMPAWGRLGILTQQQIADVIAFIVSINK